MQIEYDDVFLRWHLNPNAVSRVNRHGAAVVIELTRDHRGRPAPGPILQCLGPTSDLAALLPETLDRIGRTPYRVNIEIDAARLLPNWWRWERRRTWDWMWTTGQPLPQAGEESMTEVTDEAEVNALLDGANPSSHGRPDGEHRWFGARDDDGVLLATGAVTILPTGVGHLRGVTTLPHARRQGIGTALSARLTRIGLEHGHGVCSLGVYTDNSTAIGIYLRLGYRREHTFCSGTLVR